VTEKNSFVKQAAVLAAASLLVRFIGFLYRLPLTKLIGDEGNGIYSAGYYLYTFFLILSSAGLPAAISKMVSERCAKNKFKNAHLVFKLALVFSSLVGFLTALITGLSANCFAVFINSPKSYYAILTLAPTIFIVAVAAVFRGYFQGLDNSWPTSISQVIEQIFNAVFSIILAYILIKYNTELGAAGGTAGTGIGAFAGLLVIFIIYIFSRTKIKKNFKQDFSEQESSREILLELIKTSVPIIIGTAIFSITNLIDMKMVMSCLTKNFSEREANILYGQLTGKYVVLTTLPVSIATAIATAIVPNIAASFVLKKINLVNRKINIALRLTMIISIPSAIGIGIFGSQILAMLFPSYPNGGNLLIIGSISIIFLALAQVSTGILQGINLVHIPAIAAFCGAVIKIFLNYVLITRPNINILGAVISTIACYLIASLIDLLIVARATKTRLDLIGIIIKPSVCSIIMGMISHFVYQIFYALFKSNTLALLITILISMIIYFVLLILFRALKQEDLKLIPMGNKIIFILSKYNLLY